jgi:AAA domain
MDDGAPRSADPVTARSLLVDWANQQDGWVRQLASQVILTQKAAADEALDAIYDVFLREKALTPGDPVTVSALIDDQSTLAKSALLSLLRIDGVQNVNALVEGQVIDFNSKLTVVFGENASGKTGYVRILKSAAAIRASEAVLPNLSDERALPKGPPTARIAFRLGEVGDHVDWKNQPGLPPLNRMDVFDSRATTLHVDADLNYVYTPGELSRFPMVQQGIEGIRSRLERAIKEATVTANPFIVRFERESPIYSKIDSLGASTDLAEIKNLATVSIQERDELPNLRTEVDALRSTDPTAQIKVAEALKHSLEMLGRMVAAVAAFDVTAYSNAVGKVDGAAARYEAATQTSFAGLDIPGLQSAEWSAFVQAGEDYIRAILAEATYPSGSDNCLYCRQHLSNDAVALLRRYRDYCSNEYSADLSSARNAVDQIVGPFRRNVDVDALTRLFAEVAERIGDVSLEARDAQQQTLAGVSGVRAAIDEGRQFTWPEKLAVCQRILTLIGVAQQQNQSLLTSLAERRGTRERALLERQQRLSDIEAREKLQSILPSIEQFVERARWVDKAKIQERKFSNLLRSLTETAKSASEELLNRDFERRFREESARLRAPSVVLQFPGRQGQVTRRKAVTADHRPSEILSEGEQKVVALADFLAEVSLKPAAPVIFDDPMTSLDYKRISEVVERLTRLTDERQVVIFTHNIWFVTELLAKFDKRRKDCSYYDVDRDGDRIGIVTKGNHPRVDNFGNLKGRINELIHAATKATGEVREAVIEKAYELLRNVCEVIVETELLQGVTQRYQPNVMMTMLPKINCDGLDAAIKTIYPVFEDCCRYIGSHSQPLETLNVRPSLETLKADWAKVQVARDAYRKA